MKQQFSLPLQFLLSNHIIDEKTAQELVSQANGKTPIDILYDRGVISKDIREMALRCTSPKALAYATKTMTKQRLDKLSQDISDINDLILRADI